jgi:hypothetical protein
MLMKLNRLYVVALLIYILAIVLGVGLFGFRGGVVAGIMGPAVGLLVKIFDINNGTDSSNNSNSNDVNAESNHRTLVETHEERTERAKLRLSDRISLQENHSEEIELRINTEEIRNMDRMAMLHVFGAWAAFDENGRPTPRLTVHEIRQETELTGGAVGVFLGKMGPFIIRHYPEDPMDRSGMDEDEMEFEMNENMLEDIVDYILGERHAPD